MESQHFWSIPLDAKPAITRIGAGYHNNAAVAYFRIPGLWLLNFYHTPADLVIGGRTYGIDYGSVGVVPPGLELEYRYHSRAFHDRYAHFALPDTDERTEKIPAILQLGSDFQRLNAEIEGAAAVFGKRPERAEAKVWDILWQLVERAEARQEIPVHPSLLKAMDIIEASLDSPIHPTDIAERSSISYPHLARLFQQAYGTSIGGRVRRRRAERAEYLLRFTNLPIKQVAAQVGIPDLHTFNKMIRRECAKSPTQIRQEKSTG